jgi:hypothetical protein
MTEYATLTREQWEQANEKWNGEKFPVGIRARVRRKEDFDGLSGWYGLRVQASCGYCDASKIRHKYKCYNCILLSQNLCSDDNEEDSLFCQFVGEMRRTSPDWEKAQFLADQIGEFIKNDERRVKE